MFHLCNLITYKCQHIHYLINYNFSKLDIYLFDDNDVPLYQIENTDRDRKHYAIIDVKKNKVGKISIEKQYC